MQKHEIISEYTSLLREIKEQVAYLEELGVAEADVDLPQIHLKQTNRIAQDLVSTPVGQNRHEKFARQAPAEIPDKIVETPANKAAKPVRRRIFDDAKLSGRKPMPIPRATDEKSSKDEPETKMPEKIELKESVFEDIAEALPDSDETLEIIHADIGADCDRCKLCEKRTQVVNSKGNPEADLMFIGEAPGKDEDEQGAPFVGRAGKLLTKIIEAIDLTREDVFIGNINRCRPPENRQPQADEAEICKPFLLREIAVVRPKVIVVMGNTACQNLLDTKIGITKLRGSFKDYFGAKVMPTFHPAYLLRDPRKKREVWEDMKTVRTYLDQNK